MGTKIRKPSWSTKASPELQREIGGYEGTEAPTEEYEPRLETVDIVLVQVQKENLTGVSLGDLVRVTFHNADSLSNLRYAVLWKNKVLGFIPPDNEPLISNLISRGQSVQGHVKSLDREKELVIIALPL